MKYRRTNHVPLPLQAERLARPGAGDLRWGLCVAAFTVAVALAALYLVGCA